MSNKQAVHIDAKQHQAIKVFASRQAITMFSAMQDIISAGFPLTVRKSEALMAAQESAAVKDESDGATDLI